MIRTLIGGAVAVVVAVAVVQSLPDIRRYLRMHNM